MVKVLFAGALALIATSALADDAYRRDPGAQPSTPAQAATTAPGPSVDPRVFDPTKSSTFRPDRTLTSEGVKTGKTETIRQANPLQGMTATTPD